MTFTHVPRDAFLFALVLVAMQALQTVLVKEALIKEDAVASHRLAAGIAGVLNRAHRDNDDLLISQVLGSIEKSPGVISARLQNPEEKPSVQEGLYSYALRDGAQKWGSLVLLFSVRMRHRLAQRPFWSGVVGTALLWVGVFIHLQHLEKKISGLHTHVYELSEMLNTERSKSCDSIMRERTGRAQALDWIEIALSKISSPLMLLDTKQRVAAVNGSAAALLGVLEAHNLQGKSWQDVDGLRDCGTSLAKSLEVPDEPVCVTNDSSGRIMEFLTTHSKDGVPVGTWVRFL